jgi:hypothetical protein
MLNRRFLILLATSILLVCGCAEPSVSGTVNVDDTPLASGKIRFVPLDASLKEFSTTVHEGAFDAPQDGNIAGTYKVLVTVHFMKPADAGQYYADMEKGPPPPAGSSGGPGAPKSYELTATLKNAKNVVDFDIEE